MNVLERRLEVDVRLLEPSERLAVLNVRDELVGSQDRLVVLRVDESTDLGVLEINTVVEITEPELTLAVLSYKPAAYQDIAVLNTE